MAQERTLPQLIYFVDARERQGDAMDGMLSDSIQYNASWSSGQEPLFNRGGQARKIQFDYITWYGTLIPPPTPGNRAYC